MEPAGTWRMYGARLGRASLVVRMMRAGCGGCLADGGRRPVSGWGAMGRAGRVRGGWAAAAPEAEPAGTEHDDDDDDAAASGQPEHGQRRGAGARGPRPPH